MALIRGQNVVLLSYSGGFWKPIVCGRSCTLTTNKEIIETSITGSGVYRTYIAAGSTWTVNFDGIVYLLMDNTLALPDLRTLQEAGDPILIRFQRTDQAGNVYTDEGYGILIEIPDTGEMNNVNVFGITLQGTGPLNRIYTPTPVNPFGKVKRYQTTGGGTDTISTPLLIAVDILDVTIDGQGKSDLILSGTPIGQEAKYTSAAGSIQNAQIIDVGVNIYVLYQDL